jgi:hypothetical protein
LSFSVKEIEDYRAQNRTLSGLVNTMRCPSPFRHGDPERVRTGVVSANYFELFGFSASGEDLLPEDAKAGCSPVLVLSYEYWKNDFGSDPR